MKTDIQAGDTVVCVLACEGNKRKLPCWAFGPDEGSIWVVESIHGDCFVTDCFDQIVARDVVGLRLVGDVLELPGAWLAECFRKVFPRADEKSAAFDVRQPEKVDA